jgi:hypothetical protein
MDNLLTELNKDQMTVGLGQIPTHQTPNKVEG